MFADDHPRFIELSELTPEHHDRRQRHRSALEQRNRMNERYEAIFASNRDVFAGARVLDLASHDGRYSLAALETGAAHVTGVEVRQSLVDRAEESFAFYGQDPSTFRFVQGDVFEVLAREHFEVDVVLCFGFLYHTYRHTELMHRIHELSPRHLIVDTMVILDQRPTLKVVRERDVEDIRSAAQDPWAVDRVLVLRPSVPALQLLVESYGFAVESLYDWPGRLAGREDLPGLDGYAKGKRVTMRCRLREPGEAVVPRPIASEHSAPSAAAPTEGARIPSQEHGGWRDRVNGALARATGYELRRATSKD